MRSVHMLKRTPLKSCSSSPWSLSTVHLGERWLWSHLRTLISLVCLTSALALTPRRTHAQEDSDTGRAVALHKQAQELYKQGQFDQAERLYLKALKLIEHPDLRVRLAQVYTALERHGEALDNCTKALDSNLLTEQTRKASMRRSRS